MPNVHITGMACAASVLSVHRSSCAMQTGGWQRCRDRPGSRPCARGRRADIAPEKIENVYARSPLVAQSFVHGVSTERQLVAVVVPDPDALLPWAASRFPSPLLSDALPPGLAWHVLLLPAIILIFSGMLRALRQAELSPSSSRTEEVKVCIDEQNSVGVFETAGPPVLPCQEVRAASTSAVVCPAACFLRRARLVQDRPHTNRSWS